ncbi:hypothetical protein AA309_30760 [Microvirga vignae]|uniref:Uncharacterized protein n=1 Tax=Microvirga vignae TaxID=1225564 RepID=A0A0H1R360_9HYPH|nr:hypothetical protein AA309_30760 [Microvirga vignae]
MNQGGQIKQAIDDCATKLHVDAARGFGEKGIPGPLGDQGDGPFDPATITGACAGGDPTMSKGEFVGKDVTKKGGAYSWGYKGEMRGSDGEVWKYLGLNEQDSRAQKEEWEAYAELTAKERKEASDAVGKAIDEDIKIQEGKDEAAKKASKAKVNELWKKYEDKASKDDKAQQKAQSDPNRGPIDPAHPSHEASACSKALQAAREVLRECQRVNWTSHRCQSLQAKMNNCPDPALILVTAESGYTCMATVNSEEVRKAYVARCRELSRPADPNVDPCAPPEIHHGRFLRTSSPSHPDTCWDPRAFEISDACFGTLTIPDFGFRNLRELLVIALEKLGGPTIVLPLDFDSPPGAPSGPDGGDPRPPR